MQVTPIDDLCRGCPKEFKQYMEYCRHLKFEEQPNYDYLIGLFQNVIDRHTKK